MHKRRSSDISHAALVEPAQLTPLERHVLGDLGARLAMARALSNADNPAAFAKAVADDLAEFLVLHKVTGVDAERRQEAHEFLLHSAQEFVAACAQHPAAFEPAATAPRRTKR